MQVLFDSREPDAARLRDLAERRVRFVMRRLTWLVPRAHVRMTDINGPRGGVDKRVQLELRTEAGGTIVVTSVARDWRSALDAALARAARSIVRMWRRARSHPRVPRHPWPAAT